MLRTRHALLAAGMVLAVLAGCSSSGSKGTSSPASGSSSDSGSTTTTKAPAGATSDPKSAASSVTIQGFKFEPASLTVKLGTQVIWTNRDDVEHTVTAIPGDTLMFDGTVSGGSSYSYTFTRTGQFPYVCNNHPGMEGTIIVTE